MPTATIEQLIINSPYEDPGRYWHYNREVRLFDLLDGRRPAGYIRASERSRSFDDPGEFIGLPLVNHIRPRVKSWRESSYPGVTGVTRRLLDHWYDAEQREGRRLFYCQLEAIETLIWLTETSPAEKQGVDIPSDGGDFLRLCSKMATGSGKTIVMAMIIAWQVLNKVAYPQDTRFSKNVFVVAPGLTVKQRLQVLLPSGTDNYYDEFKFVPSGLHDKLRQGKVLIHNWHALMPIDPNDGPRVVKKGPESDEAFARRVLGEIATARNIVVINDEAHHAWRVPPKKISGVSKDELEEATRWVEGLDRIDRARGILTCFDLSATPFAPTGKTTNEEVLFDWIVSDFGLNDAIEAGLVKTPRVVVRSDGPLTSEYRSQLYHIYPSVRTDLNRRAQEHEPLPDLVINAYYLLAKDWLETANAWQKAGAPTPPVMITVANRTETAARVHHAFTHGNIHIEELSDPDRILHIDSKVLANAEAREEAASVDKGSRPVDDSDDATEDSDTSVRKLSKEEQSERLRLMVDTVGQPGRPGEQVQKVISVGMLSEGWDAKTVTHVMGLRAFTSQLLCEQVVGRGLRRTAYEVNPATGLFEAEYVNIFGVPFTFLPHEGGDGPPPPPITPKTRIEPVPENAEFEISWPNIIRIDREYAPRLSLDWAKVKPIELSPNDTVMLAELAPVIDGKPDITRLSQIHLEELGRKFRMQRIVFETARDVYGKMKPSWKGNTEYLLAQVIRLVEQFIRSDLVRITPPMFAYEDLHRRILLTLNMTRLVQHIWEAIRFENADSLVPVFDTERPIRSTGDMRTWWTSKATEVTRRSHINFGVYDSTWEATAAKEFDRCQNVEAWAKNDHLGFEILYIFNGVVHKFIPDFLIRFKSGKTLVLEVKGQDSQ